MPEASDKCPPLPAVVGGVVRVAKPLPTAGNRLAPNNGSIEEALPGGIVSPGHSRLFFERYFY